MRDRFFDPEFQNEVLRRMNELKASIDELKGRQTIKDFYSTKDVAKLLDNDEFTVREWCRLKRVHAQKKLSGRGRAREWVISNDELNRYRREGLLPLQKDNDSAGDEAG